MEKQLSQVENQKNELIEKLLHHGIYKKESLHLFELTVIELEEEYNKVIDQKNTDY
ncbi:Fur-regulated basic protein FbpA [Niallia sp. 01092]|uniref:Fur-regulated basic protein FbpA n=1 Tax=unclassified Niallia TaxID=2837522 RepID=UPI003FD169DE